MRNKYESEMNAYFLNLEKASEETVTRRKKRRRPKKESGEEL